MDEKRKEELLNEFEYSMEHGDKLSLSVITDISYLLAPSSPAPKADDSGAEYEVCPATVDKKPGYWVVDGLKMVFHDKEDADLVSNHLTSLSQRVKKVELANANLKVQASVQAQEARTQKATVMEVGALVGCLDDWEVGRVAKELFESLTSQLDQVTKTGARTREWLISEGFTDGEELLYDVIRRVVITNRDELDQVKGENEELRNMVQTACEKALDSPEDEHYLRSCFKSMRAKIISSRQALSATPEFEGRDTPLSTDEIDKLKTDIQKSEHQRRVENKVSPDIMNKEFSATPEVKGEEDGKCKTCGAPAITDTCYDCNEQAEAIVKKITELIDLGLARCNPCDPDRPYDDQQHTFQGKRGQAEIKGLTMRDIADCMIMGWLEATMRGHLIEANACDYRDVYEGEDDYDPIAVIQNTLCRVEKKMKIYPNLPSADNPHK